MVRKVVLSLAVCMVLASVGQAETILGLDFQRDTKTLDYVAPNWYVVRMDRDDPAVPYNFTFGSYDVTVNGTWAASDTTTTSVEYGSRDLSGYAGPGTSPRYNAFIDSMWVMSDVPSPSPDVEPMFEVSVAGLEPSTTYGVNYAAHWWTWQDIVQVMRAAGGTTGADVPLDDYVGNPANDPNELTAAVSGSFTTDANGLLELEIAHDRPRHIDMSHAMLSYLEIVPEPATMSLLGLGAVALLRRRKR